MLDIKAELWRSGTLAADRYMALCNAHYYATRDPLGLAGDFITAPEISQVFGELLGLWAVAEWERLGRPAPFMLVELGPGRGTLLHDALRAARVRPAFLDALQLHLVETSPVLRQVQAAAVGEFAPVWHDDLASLPAPPALPMIVIANEFFDALPVTQATRSEAGPWQPFCQLGVAIRDGDLAWEEMPIPQDAIPAEFGDMPVSVNFEFSAACRAIMRQLCAQLAVRGGSLCVIDYGDRVDPARLRDGRTLQALRHHAAADPLRHPGEADLTCHVDFAPLLQIARDAGLQTGFGTQADFLTMLGIGPRVAQLCLAHPELEAPLNIARARLTDGDQMGTLFKVLTVSSR